MKIDDLKYNPGNPRQIKGEKLDSLKRSIEQFPKMMALRPIVYDPATMEVLGGNMRLQALIALGYKEIPDEWTKSAADLTDDEKREFIIKDNVGFGDWDWDILANEWDAEQLTEWGLDLPDWAAITPDELGDGFSLPEGDREPFQEMTFTLADEQAEVIRTAISDIKGTDDFKYAETFGNENSNGNALYLIVATWAGQRI